MKFQKITAFTFIVLFLCTLIKPATAQPTEGNNGLGVVIGEPTGISFKSWMSQKNAFDLGLAWSLGRYDAINIHADYLWHNYNLINEVDNGSLPFYYGIGGRLILAENDALLGVRIPVGFNYIFEDTPLDLFIEVVPVVNVIPDTDFDVDGGVGVRYYF